MNMYHLIFAVRRNPTLVRATNVSLCNIGFLGPKCVVHVLFDDVNMTLGRISDSDVTFMMIPKPTGCVDFTVMICCIRNMLFYYLTKFQKHRSSNKDFTAPFRVFFDHPRK